MNCPQSRTGLRLQSPQQFIGVDLRPSEGHQSFCLGRLERFRHRQAHLQPHGLLTPGGVYAARSFVLLEALLQIFLELIEHLAGVILAVESIQSL